MFPARRFRIAAWPLLLAASAACSDREEARWQEIGRELLGMEAEDQEVRRALIENLGGDLGKQPDMQIALRMLQVDMQNTTRLKEIVDLHGWPRASLVGAEAARAAWMLAQHADQDPKFQAHVLELLEPLLEEGEVERGDFGLLTDRVLVARGRPQRYGTQYLVESEDGRTVLRPSTPIEDPEGLDARREQMGMPGSALYLEELRKAYQLPPDTPVRPAKSNREG